MATVRAIRSFGSEEGDVVTTIPEPRDQMPDKCLEAPSEGLPHGVSGGAYDGDLQGVADAGGHHDAVSRGWVPDAFSPPGHRVKLPADPPLYALRPRTDPGQD